VSIESQTSIDKHQETVLLPVTPDILLAQQIDQLETDKKLTVTIEQWQGPKQALEAAAPLPWGIEREQCPKLAFLMDTLLQGQNSERPHYYDVWDTLSIEETSGTLILSYSSSARGRQLVLEVDSQNFIDSNMVQTSRSFDEKIRFSGQRYFANQQWTEQTEEETSKREHGNVWFISQWGSREQMEELFMNIEWENFRRFMEAYEGSSEERDNIYKETKKLIIEQKKNSKTKEDIRNIEDRKKS